MTNQEKLDRIREAHQHVIAAYTLLLTLTDPHEEDRLSQLIERLEDFVEQMTGKFVEARTQEREQ